MEGPNTCMKAASFGPCMFVLRLQGMWPSMTSPACYSGLPPPLTVDTRWRRLLKANDPYPIHPFDAKARPEALVASIDRGPHIDPRNSVVLIIRNPPRMVPIILGYPPLEPRIISATAAAIAPRPFGFTVPA